jgi:hypothetical protein
VSDPFAPFAVVILTRTASHSGIRIIESPTFRMFPLRHEVKRGAIGAVVDHDSFDLDRLVSGVLNFNEVAVVAHFEWVGAKNADQYEEDDDAPHDRQDELGG